MNREKLNIVKDKMNQLPIDILSISESKWTGIGHFQTEYHTAYYSGQKKGKKSAIFTERKDIAKAILGCNADSD